MATEARKEPTAQWKPEVEVPVYSLEDVAKHKEKNDLWMVIHGKVYDVSKYLEDHPGGIDALIEVAGMDATAAFEDVGHSEDAIELLQPLLVGVLNDADAKKNKPKKAVRVVQRSPLPAAVSAPGSSRTGIYGAVALVACVALGIRFAIVHDLASRLPRRFLLSRPGASSGLSDFWNGVILTTAAFAAASTVAARRVSKLFAVTSGFTRYPPHKKAAGAAPVRQASGFLSPHEYKTLPLTSIEHLTPNVVRYVFALPTPTSVLGLPIGQHVAIRGTLADGTVVSRSYTPTSNNADPGRLELVVKIYDDGLLTGKYLANLKVGDLVEFRGPKGAMRYRRGYARRVGMVAGGTGITPMYQLIRAICEDPLDATQVSLVYANRSEEDILLRDELDRFARLYPRNFKVWYMLDTPGEGWTGGRGYVTEKVMQERLPAPSAETKVLLCGPPGMVKAAKNGLANLGFQAPGAVGRMTDQVFCF